MLNFHYQTHKDIISRASLIDGYSRIENFDGPFRNNQNEVVYYDPLQGIYINAKRVLQFLKFL